MTLYPCTVTPTRYGGVYERGSWAAFLIDPWDLPKGAFGGDTECSAWWSANGTHAGVGRTCEEALEALSRVDEPLQSFRGRCAPRPWPPYLRGESS